MSYSFDDEQLIKAIKTADEYYMNSLPRSGDIAYDFSKKFQKKVKKLMKLSKKKESYLKALSIKKRIAVLIIVIFTMLVSTVNVSAVKKVVSEFISFVYEKYTEIRFENSDSVTNKKFVPLKPTYIPEGFTINKEDLDGTVFIEYMKGDDYIVYEQFWKKDVTIHVNTEGKDMEDTELNGNPAKYYSNFGVQNLIWHDEKYMYCISSTLGKEEIFRIAKSVHE